MSYEVYQGNGELVERYETLTAAILDIVEHWHECNEPVCYWVKDPESLLAATLCPVGSDKAVVVYCHGQVDTYDGIRYAKSPEGRITHTEFFYNGSATPTKINQGRTLNT